jgi:O-antigen/teichoic acid export membrane protein
MAISRVPLLKGATWMLGAFGFGQVVRVVTSIILARFLAPEIFGIMQIVYSLRTGAELITDVGISQNIIYNDDANKPAFYNTAWTLQVIRGFVLWLIFCAVAVPIGSFYQSSTLTQVIPIAAAAVAILGFGSASPSMLQKRMKFSTINLFEATVNLISSAVQVVLAYLSPTIWALVFGNLVSSAVHVIGSHFILPDVKHRFFISKHYAIEMLSFGKWIFAASIIFFLSSNFDRLFLAKSIPLDLLGVYGIARSISELLSGLIQRLGYGVIFPFITSHSEISRQELRAHLAPIRALFLLVAGCGLALLAAVADLLIRLVYDQRYHAASWMLPILIIGAWFAILSNINESTLLGLGKPVYSAFGNSAKFGVLLVGLTLAVGPLGVVGGVLVVACSDLGRYVPVLFGQVRERFSFARQDALITLVVFLLVASLEWVRSALGYGTSFETFPLDLSKMFGIGGHVI